MRAFNVGTIVVITVAIIGYIVISEFARKRRWDILMSLIDLRVDYSVFNFHDAVFYSFFTFISNLSD